VDRATLEKLLKKSPKLMTSLDLSRDARSYRLSNIDMLRGLVIVIMAIDHVRDYFHATAALDIINQPDIPLSLFLTRWVTNFCAPVFIFLAGTSAGLMAARKSPAELGGFLIKRGLWLIIVELTIVSTAWTFAPLGIDAAGGAVLIILQVIWAIGASMVALGVAQFLGPRACLILGLVIVIGHNALDGLWPDSDLLGGTSSPLFLLFYQGSYQLGPLLVVGVYPLLAWFGVMLLGFGSAFIFEWEADRRDVALTKIGLLLIVGFFLLRGLGYYGDANGWFIHGNVPSTAMDFLNVTKYPPSLLFLMITLGPMLLVCAGADRLSGRLKEILVMFGRVPFAFYVLHLYLIHALALLLGLWQGYTPEDFFVPYMFLPEGYGIGLPAVYLVWALVILMLYPVCKWFAELKNQRKDWWLSYL
jgi:uncharacterized membrane protein